MWLIFLLWNANILDQSMGETNAYKIIEKYEFLYYCCIIKKLDLLK